MGSAVNGKELKVQMKGHGTTSRLFVTCDRLLLEFGKGPLAGASLVSALIADMSLSEKRSLANRYNWDGFRWHEWGWQIFGGQTYLVLKPLTMPEDPCAFLSGLLKMSVTLAE